MWEFFSKLFDPAGFPPRWDCGPAWAASPGIGWLHIVSDLATFAAYYAVPCVVGYFVSQRRNLKFPPVFYVFLGLIFFSCGTVHLIEAGIFWWPVYRASGLAKLLTAVVSCAGVVVLVKVLPRALELRSPEAFRHEVAERKRAEVQLEFERNLLHTLMNHLPDAIYFKDRESRFLRISRAHAEKFGLTDPEAAVEKTDADFFSEEHARQAQRDEQQILETAEPLVGILEKETWPDGRTTWVSTTKAPFHDQNGRLIGTFGISRDVTKIKQTEEKLTNVAVKLALPRELSEADRNPIKLSEFSLKDMISCGDDIRAMGIRQDSRDSFADGLVRYLYERIVDDAGQPAFALVRLFQLRSLADLEQALQQLAAESAGQAKLPPLTKCLTLMGTVGDCPPWNDRQQSQNHRVIPLRSVEAVEQLPMISQLIRQLGFDVAGILESGPGDMLENSATGVFHVQDARHSASIPAQEDFVIPFEIRSVVGFGDVLPSGELFAVIGFSKVDLPKHTAILFSHLSLSTKLAMLAFESPESRVEAQIVVVDQLLRNYEEVVCSQEAKLNEMMRDLVRTKDAAEAANRAKSDFLANMSHEIRTPMNAILGLTELVLDSRLTATQRDYLATVLESGESLLSIINEILDFSKIEAGRVELESLAFSLREELGDTMKSLALRAHHKILELAWQVNADVPDSLMGDPSRLRQIMVNLVGNAIKFTEQGEVVLDVRMQAEMAEQVVLQFSVRDTGIGIPREKREAIFGAFEQADTSTTRRFGGTGLGLAISSTLVELMGGRIWLESPDGGGSSFHFTARFGLASAPVVKKIPADPQSVEHMPVLVVDDNNTNRRILCEILSNWRMRPTAVASGSEALEALRKMDESGTPYPLVLTDVHMPDMDGLMLAEAIRANPNLSSTVIIALTSGGRAEDAGRREKLRISAQLLKPVKQSELLNAIVSAVAPTATERRRETPPLPSPSPSTRTLRILLAEDGLSNQKLAMGLLQNWGHRVTLANDGREALELWSKEAFDLVLMDVQMPKMDGLESTKLIRQQEQQTGGHIPIVAMTAHALKGDREKCLAAGMDGYVAKPIRRDELHAAIQPYVGQSSLDPIPPGSAVKAEEEINWEMALDAVGGDSQLLRDVAQEAVRELPTLQRQFEQALRDEDAAVARRSAHTIQGTVQLFDAQEISRLAEAMEEHAKSAELREVEHLYQRIRPRIERFVAALEDFLASPPDEGG